MTENTYADHLRHRLSVIEGDIAKGRRKLESGSVTNKAAALRDLSKLEILHREIEKRLETAAKQHSEKWSAAKVGLREEIDGLSDTLENWIIRNI